MIDAVFCPVWARTGLAIGSAVLLTDAVAADVVRPTTFDDKMTRANGLKVVSSFDTDKAGREVVAETDRRSAAAGETLRLTVNAFIRLERDPVSRVELRGAQDFPASQCPRPIESSSAPLSQLDLDSPTPGRAPGAGLPPA